MDKSETNDKTEKDSIENTLEQERQKLHSLIDTGASKKEIQKQSEILDIEIINHYSVLK